ncbi:MAG TPA: HlyD family efflux transporter periplasmic adaptor subunit [Bacteroides sp.]|nr:HlyD family efflux transporter periplasmic adaptor subunit [Bacteroides sp.]
MQKFIISISALVVLAGCSGRDNLSDAYGNFETIEYLISAEGQGKIMEFNLKEGEALEKGQVVGYIDTVAIHLQIEQLKARIRAVEAQRSAVRAQTEVFQTQKKTLLVEKARLEKLLADKAATGKQLDDLNGQLAGLDAQIISTRTRYETIKAEILSLQAQVEITRDQLSRNIFVNPVDGTVLEKYTEAYEMAVPGKALYKIADLNTMILRVYISGDQLASVKIGQEVGVIIDDNVSSEDPLKGRISWVSGKSEFTPKIIQTREERVKLVYAVKIEVSNDGRLKIGMPGEIIL